MHHTAIVSDIMVHVLHKVTFSLSIVCLSVLLYLTLFMNITYNVLDKSSHKLQEEPYNHGGNMSNYTGRPHQDYFQPIVRNTSYVFSAFFDNRRGGGHIEVKVFYILKAAGSADTRGFPRFCFLYYPDGKMLTTAGKTVDWFQMSKPR